MCATVFFTDLSRQPEQTLNELSGSSRHLPFSTQEAGFRYLHFGRVHTVGCNEEGGFECETELPTHIVSFTRLNTS